MENMVSSVDKQPMVSSFLGVAVGQSVHTAHHFLQATNWNLEDALGLYYMGAEARVASSSSYVPPVEHTVLSSDHHHSLLEENIRIASAGHGVGDEAQRPLSMVSGAAHYVDEVMLHDPATPLQSGTTLAHVEVGFSSVLSNHSVGPCASPQIVQRQQSQTHGEMAACTSDITVPNPPLPATRRRRRTRAEMAASTSDIRVPDPPLPATSRRRRTRAEMAAAASSFAAGVSPLAPSGVAQRRPRRTRAQMAAAAAAMTTDSTLPTVHRQRRTRAQLAAAAAASLSGAAARTTDSTLPSARRQRQTRVQMDAAASHILDLTTAVPQGNVPHWWLYSHVEPNASANTPVSLQPDLLTPVDSMAATRKRGRSHSETPAVVHIATTYSRPREESDPAVPRRPRRTQIELAIDAYTPALYKRPTTRIPKVRVSVPPRGLGMRGKKKKWSCWESLNPISDSCREPNKRMEKNHCSLWISLLRADLVCEVF